MIDTIKFTCDRPFAPAVREALERKAWSPATAPGWTKPSYYGPYVEDDEDEDRRRYPVKFTHVASGLKAWGDTERIGIIECSLPRLLHGTNGRLIKSPAELNQAWELLEEILAEISTPERPILDLQRLDLVWNIYFENPQRILLLFRNAKWPKVRRDTAMFSKEDPFLQTTRTSVRFRGKDIVFHMYDKKAERRRRRKRKENQKQEVTDCNPSKCLRVEVQLKSKDRIRTEFNEQNLGMIDVQGFGFPTLYMVFRKLVMLLEPKTPLGIPPKITMSSLLAMGEFYHAILEEKGLLDQVPWGVSPLALYAAEGRRSDTVRETTKRAQLMQLQLCGFSWADHLPELAPPAGVDVYPNGQEFAVRSRWFGIPDTWRLPHGD